MLMELWPPVTDSLKDNPDHEHAKQWNKWISAGLNERTELSTLKNIVGIYTLDQLYLILRDSPAINKHFDIAWYHRIMHRPKHYDIPELKSRESISAKRHAIKSVTDRDIEFCILHKTIFAEIMLWMEDQTNTQDHRSMQWRKWLFAGLKPIQPAHKIRKITSVTNIHEYIQKLHPYPPLQH